MCKICTLKYLEVRVSCQQVIFKWFREKKVLGTILAKCKHGDLKKIITVKNDIDLP